MNNITCPIIDSHAHIFPEKIAIKASVSIGEYYGINMVGNGTIKELLERGKKINVSKYIVHSSATKPDQVIAVNNFICQSVKENNKFVGLGTLHPDFDDIENEFERVISLGLKGIKLHPEFQHFSIDDEKAMKIYEVCEGKLPILMHMGDENVDSSSPDRLSKVIQKFPKLTVIAAHLGGYQMWSEAFHFLVGKNVYLDTSSSLFFLSADQAVKIMRKHGTGKILFGTDYPMWDHKEELDRFLALDLTEKEREDILWKNAAKLYDIKY